MASSVVQQDAFAGTPHQRPRPSRYDSALRLAAAEATYPRVEEWIRGPVSDAERDRIIRLLADRCGDDGYEIARVFEREGYAPDAQLVDILDGLDTHSVHAAAVIEWLAETGAKPKLPIGAHVAIPAVLKEHEGVVGEIVRIDERAGTYLVCCASLGHVREGLGTRGLIFAWEAVEDLPVSSAAPAAQDDSSGDAARVLGGTV